MSDTSVFVVNGRDADGERTAFRIRSAFVVVDGDVQVSILDIECG